MSHEDDNYRPLGRKFADVVKKWDDDLEASPKYMERGRKQELDKALTELALVRLGYIADGEAFNPRVKDFEDRSISLMHTIRENVPDLQDRSDNKEANRRLAKRQNSIRRLVAEGAIPRKEDMTKEGMEDHTVLSVVESALHHARAARRSENKAGHSPG